jgi:hypothetical protein
VLHHDNPAALVASLNLHRRHLTPDERHGKLVRLLKLHPEKSDRAIAAETGFSDTTVLRARKKATASNEAVGKRTGRDGKSRRMPAKKPKYTYDTETDAAMDAVREILESKIETDASALRERQAREMQDVGPDSNAEVARERVHLDELAATNHRVEMENRGLRSDVGDLQREIEKLKKPDISADVNEPITLQAAIEALIYWSKHVAFASFGNALPEDAVFSRGELDEAIRKLRFLNASESMVERRLAKRREVIAAKQKPPAADLPTADDTKH